VCSEELTPTMDVAYLMESIHIFLGTKTCFFLKFQPGQGPCCFLSVILLACPVQWDSLAEPWLLFWT